MSRNVVARPVGIRRVTRAVSDGTGRPPDEVVVLAAATAAVAVSVAAWRGIAWAVDAVTGVDLWPTLPGRARG